MANESTLRSAAPSALVATRLKVRNDELVLEPECELSSVAVTTRPWGSMSSEPTAASMGVGSTAMPGVGELGAKLVSSVRSLL